MVNALIARALPLVPKPIIFAVARKYIAGPNLADAVAESRRLNSAGRTVTIDILGEHITELQEAETAANQYLTVLERLTDERIEGNVSVKPTQLGLGINRDSTRDIFCRLLSSAREKGTFIRIDMEDSPFTDATLELYRNLRGNGYDNVGVVLQAYLKRTMNDIEALAPLMTMPPSGGGKDIRLCKGIYIEPADIAYKSREEIRANFRRALDRMLDLGISVGIATHDAMLIEHAFAQIAKRNLPKEQFEFQMLLGVLPELGQRIVERGHPLRVYVPFGEQWFAYCTRRLKENPQMVGHIMRAMLHLPPRNE